MMKMRLGTIQPLPMTVKPQRKSFAVQGFRGVLNSSLPQMPGLGAHGQTKISEP